ncbi:hypothetical protein DIPPA_13181, partial [Diplonema papillatum]
MPVQQSPNHRNAACAGARDGNSVDHPTPAAVAYSSTGVSLPVGTSENLPGKAGRNAICDQASNSQPGRHRGAMGRSDARDQPSTVANQQKPGDIASSNKGDWPAPAAAGNGEVLGQRQHEGNSAYTPRTEPGGMHTDVPVGVCPDSTEEHGTENAPQTVQKSAGTPAYAAYARSGGMRMDVPVSTGEQGTENVPQTVQKSAGNPAYAAYAKSGGMHMDVPVGVCPDITTEEHGTENTPQIVQKSTGNPAYAAYAKSGGMHMDVPVGVCPNINTEEHGTENAPQVVQKRARNPAYAVHAKSDGMHVDVPVNTGEQGTENAPPAVQKSTGNPAYAAYAKSGGMHMDVLVGPLQDKVHTTRQRTAIEAGACPGAPAQYSGGAPLPMQAVDKPTPDVLYQKRGEAAARCLRLARRRAQIAQREAAGSAERTERWATTLLLAERKMAASTARTLRLAGEREARCAEAATSARLAALFPAAVGEVVRSAFGCDYVDGESVATGGVVFFTDDSVRFAGGGGDGTRVGAAFERIASFED